MIDNKNSHQIPEIKHSWTIECQPPPKDGEVIQLSIEEINEDFFKSRDIINDEEQKILTESIRENGLINAITVQVINDAFFLVAGNRRLHAAKEIGLKTVPCIIKNGDPYVLALIENLHRKDLTPIQEAETCLKLKLVHRITQKKLSKILKKSTTNMNDILRLNDLPDTIKNEWRNDSNFSRRFFLEILKQKTQEKRVEKFRKNKEKLMPKSNEGHNDSKNLKVSRLEDNKDHEKYSYLKFPVFS